MEWHEGEWTINLRWWLKDIKGGKSYPCFPAVFWVLTLTQDLDHIQFRPATPLSSFASLSTLSPFLFSPSPLSFPSLFCSFTVPLHRWSSLIKQARLSPSFECVCFWEEERKKRNQWAADWLTPVNYAKILLSAGN